MIAGPIATTFGATGAARTPTTTASRTGRSTRCARTRARADTDRDGLRDGDELKVASNPLRADSDGDGIRDGDENAGVITAFDGTVLSVRRFNGPAFDAIVDDASSCAGSDERGRRDRGGAAARTTAPADSEDAAETVVDLGGDDDYGYAGCADPRIKPGAIVSSVELTGDDGELIATAVNLAPPH